MNTSFFQSLFLIIFLFAGFFCWQFAPGPKKIDLKAQSSSAEKWEVPGIKKNSSDLNGIAKLSTSPKFGYTEPQKIQKSNEGADKKTKTKSPFLFYGTIQRNNRTVISIKHLETGSIFTIGDTIPDYGQISNISLNGFTVISELGEAQEFLLYN